MKIKDAINKIRNKDIWKMTIELFEEYEPIMKKQPTSLSGDYHKKGEVQLNHIEDALDYAILLAENFKIEGIDLDILISATILHDISNCEFVRKTRTKRHFQKLYPTGYNRSSEAYCYHPTLGSFIIGRYIVGKGDLISALFMVARLVSSHMSHWLEEYNRKPDSLLEYILCTADYLSSRRNVKIISGDEI